jgi:ABC-type multidrug transport system fused ATPase/permease subunit
MVQLERLCRQHRKSIITISHRLEALKGYDRIYCVEEGVIKEFGTFEELSSRPNSLFSRLRNLN